MFGTILTFTDMSVVWVLTRGGPVNETQVLATWAYAKGIEGGDLAQGAAIALFLLPLLLAATIAILRAVRRLEVHVTTIVPDDTGRGLRRQAGRRHVAARVGCT